MHRFFLACSICLYAVIAAASAATPRRLAIVEIETDYLGDDEKAEILKGLKRRLAVSQAYQGIPDAELKAAFSKPNPLRLKVEETIKEHAQRYGEIQEQLKEAERLYAASEFEKSVTVLESSFLSLNSAVLALQRDLPVEILTMLAASEFFLDHQAKAKVYLGSLLDLDPGAILSAQKFPPEFLELFNKVREDIRYTWQILERPSNVKGVQGKFMGQSIEIEEGETLKVNLPLGHPVWESRAVVLEAEGYAPIIFSLAKPPKKLEFVSIQDERANLKGLFKPIGNSTAPTELRRVSSRLKADLVLLASAERLESGSIKLNAQWIEEGTGVTSPVVEAKDPSIATVVEKVSSRLLEFISPDGRVQSEKFVSFEDEPRAAVKRPYYQTWWFWTLLGVATVGGATGSYFLLKKDDRLKVQLQPAQ